MSTYTMLIEKGKLEGEQIGIQKGKLEEKTEMVLTLFDEGFDTASIARFVKLPEEEVVYRIFQLEGDNANFFQMIVVYSLQVSDIQEEQLAEVIKSIPEPIKEKIMSTYTMLIEKGKLEGEQIGIQKGKLEEKTEMVFTLFEEGIDTTNIARLVKLPEEEVVKILKDNGRLE